MNWQIFLQWAGGIGIVVIGYAFVVGKILNKIDELCTKFDKMEKDIESVENKYVTNKEFSIWRTIVEQNFKAREELPERLARIETELQNIKEILNKRS